MASYYLQFSTRITDGLVWIQIMKRYMSVAGDDCIDVNADLLLRISLLHKFLYLTRNLTNGKSSGKELRPRGTENLTNTHWNGSTLFARLFRQGTHVGNFTARAHEGILALCVRICAAQSDVVYAGNLAC